MFKILLGAVIGSLVTYNFILPNDDYRETFEDFNDWTTGKIEQLFEDPPATEQIQEAAQDALDTVQETIEDLK